MSTTCEISFNQPSGVFYSGQNLKGKVKLVTARSKSIRAVHIQINGYAKVRWDESRSRTNSEGKTEHYTVEYSAHDNYISSRTYVIGTSGGPTIEFPSGTHEYTFACFLPLELPTSISGKYGHVRYEVEVTIDRPLRFDNVFKQAFTVIRNLDLNIDPSFASPREGHEVKYFCCWCCSSGPVSTRFTIPYGSYAPGQRINYKVLIDNEAHYDVEGSKVRLLQEITFESRYPEKDTKTEKNVIAQEMLGGALKLSRKELIGSFQLPSIPPTTMNAFEIIRIHYYITAEIETGICHRNDEVHIPVLIGTVPLIASATNSQNIIAMQPTAPALENGSTDSPPPYNATVPPSFEEAMGLNDQFVDSENNPKHQEAPFTPKYPFFYNFAQPSAPPMNAQPSTMKSSEKTPLTSSISHTSYTAPASSNLPITQQPAAVVANATSICSQISVPPFGPPPYPTSSGDNSVRPAAEPNSQPNLGWKF